MPNLSIKDVSEDLAEALRQRAARNHRGRTTLGVPGPSADVGGLQRVDCRDALDRYVQHAIELHRPDVQAQYSLAMRYGLSACGAAYLWLAGLLQAPLATAEVPRNHV